VIRDFAAALSLANLCFIEVWFGLLFMPPSSTYFLGAPRGPLDYVASIANVLLLTAVVWASLRSCRQIARPWARAVVDLLFFMALLVPLNALRINVKLPLGISRFWHWISLAGHQQTAIVMALLAVLALARWHHVLARGAFLLLLVLSPFSVLTLGRAAVSAAGLVAQDSFPPVAVAPALPFADKDRPRVLWLLFDELDESMIASRRPPGLALPEIDRLRAESLQATSAQSPSFETIKSLPALLTGRFVVDAKARGPADLGVTFAGTQSPVSWVTEPNLFCQARELGYETEVVGWYHPYCRLFGACLTRCSFEPIFLNVVARDAHAGLIERMTEQALAILPINSRRLSIRSYRRLAERAALAASRPGPGLVFVHFSVPHVPAIFDRTQNRFTLGRISHVSGYVDNLVLADKALGSVRQALQAGRLWDRTTVIVTSDHWWRESWAFDGRADREIPFLLKLAGQPRPLTYAPKFNTVVTKDLVLALLAGEVRSSEEAAAWLDRHLVVSGVPPAASPAEGPLR
jgi:hypothetical protein